jgi:polyhydroxyalkanoate synthesis repressor PhaR
VQQNATIVIRKYANRRLYDTASGKYINLQEIAELVRKGASVQVMDAKTGEDLTRVVLTQIILEDAKDQPTGLPLELLRQLILASDRAGREFIMWYLKSAFEAYRRVQETIQSGLQEARTAALSPFNVVRNLFGVGSSQETNEELEQLRRRVAELEEGLRKRRR